jgi:hypothetical protein
MRYVVVVAAAFLVGCAAAPPIPLSDYLPIRDAARDYMGAVERDACPRSSKTAVALCEDTGKLRERLKPADATLIKGYSEKGLTAEQWRDALSVVTGVMREALGTAARLGLTGGIVP